MGAVVTASSDAPISMTGLAEALIWFAAAVASAGSPLVSNGLQTSLLRSTPPAALTSAAPVRHPAMPIAPSSALGPVKGKITPTFNVFAPPGLPPDPPDDPQAARASTEAGAMTSPGIELRGSAFIDTSPSGSAHGTRGLGGVSSSEQRTRGIDCNDYCLEGRPRQDNVS